MDAGYPSPRYAQVGWWEDTTGDLHRTFSEVWKSGFPGYVRRFGAAKPAGSYPYYTVLYHSANQRVQFQVDGSYFPNPGYYETISWSPTRGQIGGEIHNLASQMPGAQLDAAGIFDAKVWRFGAWVNFDGTEFVKSHADFR